MDLDASFVVSSSSCSSSSSSTSPSPTVADPMVRVELEAAEALADLAHLAMRETNGVDSNGKWGSKGKRAKKRVKSESPSSDSAWNPVVDSVVVQSVPFPDVAEADRQLCEPLGKNVLLTYAKLETDSDLTKTSPKCGRTCPSYGGARARQNLTEAEKEQRRLRRVLANRESARQTIRRRQALCEELTRKAADLAQENQNLKKEKEAAFKEFQSLETINKHLKRQMAKVIKAEVQESQGNVESAYREMPSNPATNCPMLLYNHHPFSSLCWPSVVRSSNSAQLNHLPQNGVVISSGIPITFSGKLDSYQQHQETRRTPLYLVSCPWFFPVPDHSNGLLSQSTFGLKHVQNGATANKQCSDSMPSTGTAFSESGHLSLPLKVKPEADNSTELGVLNDIKETPRFPTDGGGQCAGALQKEILTPQMPCSIKNDTGLQSECTPSSAGIYAKISQLISSIPEKTLDQFKFSSKKLVDAAAAAEARKRRKELTKLKNLHGRQCRLNC
ncbi:hypothetical protein K2173_002117 [Erythroxylum novogranatense]|uniref:BZIP domain-containing protein n=1 Tax=Erythroxylum novogranatense TaxID=1862640 RepID=A0AAV8SPL2_9ROSI|nr:hypothetical protein K2173_002117 [Erythroxylum novogranatense]